MTGLCPACKAVLTPMAPSSWASAGGVELPVRRVPEDHSTVRSVCDLPRFTGIDHADRTFTLRGKVGVNLPALLARP